MATTNSESCLRFETASKDGIDHLAERNRSYQVRLSYGDRVRARRDLHVSRHDGNWEHFEYATIPAGTTFTVHAESNAGFRGIEASASFEGGWHLSVSTGAVDRVRS